MRASCRFGPRFPALSCAYDRELRELAKETVLEQGMDKFVQVSLKSSSSDSIFTFDRKGCMCTSLGPTLKHQQRLAFYAKLGQIQLA